MWRRGRLAGNMGTEAGGRSVKRGGRKCVLRKAHLRAQQTKKQMQAMRQVDPLRHNRQRKYVLKQLAVVLALRKKQKKNRVRAECVTLRPFPSRILRKGNLNLRLILNQTKIGPGKKLVWRIQDFFVVTDTEDLIFKTSTEEDTVDLTNKVMTKDSQRFLSWFHSVWRTTTPIL